MARLTRLVVPGEAHHLVHRTVAGTNGFPTPADYVSFTEALQRSSREHRVALHAYVLLPDQIQLLATPPAAESLGRMMQALARFYVPAFNRQHGRSGALWQGRFRGAPVGGAEPLLACMRYIEQAPSRSGIASSPVEHEWSSARSHSGSSAAAVLTPVPPASAYWRLGNTPFEREAAYRELLERPLPADQVRAIESTTLMGWAFGSGEFLASIASSGLRRNSARAPGRPKTQSITAEQATD